MTKDEKDAVDAMLRDKQGIEIARDKLILEIMNLQARVCEYNEELVGLSHTALARRFKTTERAIRNRLEQITTRAHIGVQGVRSGWNNGAAGR